MGMSDGTTTGSQWWRWPLMPFAAVFGGAIGALLFTLLQWVGMKFQGGASVDGWMFAYVVPVLSTAAFGYVYAYLACTVAPRAKFTTGVAMTSVLGVFSLVAGVLMWFNPEYATGRAALETVQFLAGMAGAISALVQVRDELNKR
jgi:hypothetical protein